MPGERWGLAAWTLANIVAISSCMAAHAAEVTKNSIGMSFVRVAAGEFWMGSEEKERGRRGDELRHRVRITRAYWMGQYEVTRGDFRKFVDETRYKTESERDGQGGYGVDPATGRLDGRDRKYTWRYPGFEQTDAHPVVNVTWNDAVEFCGWLSRREGRVYRLPREAEWEFACRAGTATAYANGDDPERLVELGNIVDALLKAKFPERIAIAGRDGYVFTAPVGRFKPNALSIYDTHGNVWEWCADWYGPYSADLQVDPQGPSSGPGRVIRGGDWYHDGSFARSAGRYYIPPSLPRRHGGFRVVMEQKE